MLRFTRRELSATSILANVGGTTITTVSDRTPEDITRPQKLSRSIVVLHRSQRKSFIIVSMKSNIW